MVLLAVTVITILNIVLLLIRMGSQGHLQLKIMIGVLWGVFCLLYGAVMYIGIFKLGFTRMTKYFWTAFLVLVVIMIIILPDLIISPLKDKIESITNFAGSGLWIFLAVAGGVLYFFLYKYAITAKEQSEEV